MSDKKIQLSIFDPLGEYFKVMKSACGDISKACSNDKFKSIISNDCDVSGNITSLKDKNLTSERFKKALELFALNLKTFDYPISTLTIKGGLYKHFTDAFKSSAEYEGKGDHYKLKNPNIVLDKFVKKINDSKLLNMDSDWKEGGSETYKENLRNTLTSTELKNYDKSSDKDDELMNNIFNIWLNNVFDIYGNSLNRFDEFMDDIKHQWDIGAREIEPAHEEAFNFFFEVVTGGAKKNLQGKNSFWESLLIALSKSDDGDHTPFDNLKKDTRINIKIVDSYGKLTTKYTAPKLGDKNLQAGIVYALPVSVRKEFNEKLKENNSNKTGEIKPENFYKIKDACKSGAYKLDEAQVKQVFNFIKSGVSTNNIQPYINEFIDTEKYSDGSNSYSFEDFEKDIKKNKNAWAKDNKNDLYTRWYYDEDGEEKLGKKWHKYTEKQAKKDIESFKNKDENCGHLCIFEDPVQCNEFFKNMTQGKEITYETLALMVNGNSFKDDYERLKDNIVKVNPMFVIGTLKAFKFDKWEQLNRDGTKTIKVESFSRWWSRKGNEFMQFPGSKPLKTSGEKTHSNPKDGEEQLLPLPPANLELFLKLLVSFINNNAFVLNPQSKNNIEYNRLKITSIDPHDDDNPEFLHIIEDGIEKTVPNGAYKPNNSNSTVGSLGSALELIKKNNNKFSPIESTSENRSILDVLTGLSYGWNPHGKLMFSKSLPYSTGLGRIGALSGGAELNFDDEEAVKNYGNTIGSCAKTALDGLYMARKSLRKKNKTINLNELNKIVQSIEELANLEKELYEKLILIGKYEKIVNDLQDNSVQDVGIKEMEDELNNYKNIATDVSIIADGITISFSNLLGTSRSSYSQL
jgi:hypothetical protein